MTSLATADTWSSSQTFANIASSGTYFPIWTVVNDVSYIIKTMSIYMCKPETQQKKPFVSEMH